MKSGARQTPPDHHYRVRAVDGDATVGGLGAQLPAWTELEVYRTADTVQIVWQPVVDTVDGRSSVVDRYEIYSSDTPFSRSDVRDGLLPAPVVESSTSIEFPLPAGSRYYSVLAVDVLGNVSPF